MRLAGSFVLAAVCGARGAAQDSTAAAGPSEPQEVSASVQEAAVQEPAPDEDVVLRVVVTGVVGDSVFVDRGREGGLEPGDRVRFEPPGRPVVIGEVRAVSSTSARVELASGGPLDVGEEGEVRVPRSRLLALQAEAPPVVGGPEPPVHPPWTHPPEEWSVDQPLLAPPRGLTPSEREVRRSGRWFVQGDATFDRQDGDSTSLLGRAGLDATWENLFGRGGTFELDAEVVHRSFEDDFDSDDESRLRLQRLSYAVGGDRGHPSRWQVGRFLQRGFVEFGLLDGVEVSRRVGVGDGSVRSFGVAVGLLPEQTFDLGTGRDAQIAAWARRDSTARTGLSWGVGYQKSFHDGDADRDLVALDADWRPSTELAFHGSLLVDWYTSGERAKDAGPELTELHLFASWRPGPDGGASLSLDRTRPPDVDRAGFGDLTPEQVREQFFERVGLTGWRRLTPDLRLTARIDTWRNDQDEGGGAELRLSKRDLLVTGLEGNATVFVNDGTFTSVRGLRLGLDHSSSAGLFGLGWELVESEQDGAVLGDDTLVEQSLRASWDHSFGAAATSLYAEHFFGDGRDATSLGFFLQWRL